jgi:hypothetical protein
MTGSTRRCLCGKCADRLMCRLLVRLHAKPQKLGAQCRADRSRVLADAGGFWTAAFN